MNNIYALIDRELLNKYSINLVEYCKFLNSFENIKIIQYRNKTKNSKIILEDLNIINKNLNKKVIINDYIEFIELVDGLHIGQDDLRKYNSIEAIRVKIGNKILGLSTHNTEEIKIANSLKIDYIGLGAYRATQTKDVSEIGGEKLLNIAKKSNHKVAIIGGVKLNDDFNKYDSISYKVIGSDLIREFLK